MSQASPGVRACRSNSGARIQKMAQDDARFERNLSRLLDGIEMSLAKCKQ
jgi:hypothetical protein